MIESRKMVRSFALILTIAAVSTSVFAHADLLRSRPGNGGTLKLSPKTVDLTFTKQLQVVSMNSVVVTGQDGRRFDKNSVVISDDGKQMRTELEDLGSGTYTVEWKALTTDDHTIKGKFTFSVELPSGAGSASPSTPEQRPSSDLQMPMDHQMPGQESGTNWQQSGIRWLLYLAMMLLFGGFTFRLLVLKPSLQQAPDLTEEERAFAFRRGEDRFLFLTWLGLGLLALAAVASLILQTSSVLDVSIGRAFSPSLLFQVLSETSYGAPWLLQVAAIFALLIVVVLIARQRTDEESGLSALESRSTLLWIAFGIGAALFLVPSLTGHARAAASEYRFAILSDWLHLIGVGVWVGGLFHLVLTSPKSIAHLHGVRRVCVVSRLIPLFSRVAILSTVLIALTGIYNSWVHVDSFSALWTTPYGQVLSLKIIFFLPMIALGGINTFLLRPRAERAIAQTASAGEHKMLDKSFYRLVRVEAAIGVAVLLLAAILAFLPPARQHEMSMPEMEMNR